MKKYDWIEVNSSMIEKLAYDDDTRELLVGFKGNRQYYYVNVPKSLYEKLLCSTSKGKFLIENIKGTYGYGIL